MSAPHTNPQKSERLSDQDRTSPLSRRQIECLFWVQEGKSSRDIGLILDISHRSVERHVFKACAALGVKTRLQAVIRARSLGVIGDRSEPVRGSRYA